MAPQLSATQIHRAVQTKSLIPAILGITESVRRHHELNARGVQNSNPDSRSLVQQHDHELGEVSSGNVRAPHRIIGAGDLVVEYVSAGIPMTPEGLGWR